MAPVDPSKIQMAQDERTRRRAEARLLPGVSFPAEADPSLRPAESSVSSGNRFREAARILEIEGAARPPDPAGGRKSPENTAIPPAGRSGVAFSVTPGAAAGRTPDIEVRFSRCARTDRGATFEVGLAGAASVQIAGDFNDWKPEPMLPDAARAGLWRMTKPLPQGEYRYKFIVNGEWMNDPLNPLRKPNPFGGTDSIARISDGPTPAP